MHAAYLGTLILECGLHFLASLANELRHDLLIIVVQGKVGGDAAVVTPQQAYCSPVVCTRCIDLGVVVAHRHARLPQCGDLEQTSGKGMYLTEGEQRQEAC